MAGHGIVGEEADDIYARIQAFANFGFAESHAISFALLVYASSWLKLHYPGAFLAGLLRAQPMGFYSPQSLVADARRHGVRVLRPDIARSGVDADLESLAAIHEPAGGRASAGTVPAGGRASADTVLSPSKGSASMRPTGMDACLEPIQPEVGAFDRNAPDRTRTHRRDGNVAVRLGLTEVQGIGRELAAMIVAERERATFCDLNDVVRRTGLNVKQTEALATAGAFDCFGLTRRQALWSAGYGDSPETLPGSAIDAAPPTLPGMKPVELTLADLWATRISPDDHPIGHLRSMLDQHEIIRIADLGPSYADRRIRVAGLVTHRQRPSTAGGVTFLNLEDETGMLNVVCAQSMWHRYRRVGRRSNAMIIRGKIEYGDGVTNLVADRLEPLSSVLPDAGRALQTAHRSRDFH
jgi:error-prone DNA polymerase